MEGVFSPIALMTDNNSSKVADKAFRAMELWHKTKKSQMPNLKPSRLKLSCVNVTVKKKNVDETNVSMQT